MFKCIRCNDEEDLKDDCWVCGGCGWLKPDALRQYLQFQRELRDKKGVEGRARRKTVYSPTLPF